jgi:hypothetical protein
MMKTRLSVPTDSSGDERQMGQMPQPSRKCQELDQFSAFFAMSQIDQRDRALETKNRSKSPFREFKNH